MVISWDKFPCPTPGPGLEVQEAEIVQYAILVTAHSTTDKQLVVVDDCRVARTTPRYRTVSFGLCPVRSLDVKDDNVREMYAMLVLPSIDKEFVAFPETSCVTHAHAGNVSIVVNQTPLARIEIEFEHVIVDLVCVLIEATEGVDAVVADVSDRGVDQAGRALPDSGDDLGHVGLGGLTTATFHRRTPT